MRKTNNQSTKTKRNTVNCGTFLAMDIRAKTEAQRMMIEGYIGGRNVVAYGSAGSGKSFIACYLALKDLQRKEKNKIIIVRSAVPTRDQGFLPGSLEEKSAIYQAPYIGIINELCQNDSAWEILTKKKIIQFMTTSYVRGINLDNSIIIIDEFQNMVENEIYSLLTRVGENTQVILCGDTKQTDLNKKKEESCFTWMMKIAERMPDWFYTVRFMPSDIVRSEFVKKLIMTSEDI